MPIQRSLSQSSTHSFGVNSNFWFSWNILRNMDRALIVCNLQGVMAAVCLRKSETNFLLMPQRHEEHHNMWGIMCAPMMYLYLQVCAAIGLIFFAKCLNYLYNDLSYVENFHSQRWPSLYRKNSAYWRGRVIAKYFDSWVPCTMHGETCYSLTTAFIYEPCYRWENRAMPLYISICIEFYNGVVQFLCHSTHFLLVFVCRLHYYLSKSDKY